MIVKTTDSDRPTTEPLGLQRWEDEGGQTIETSVSMPDRTLVHLVPIRARRHITSLQWNERFVIQAFQPGNAIILMREDRIAKGKPNG